MKKIFTLTISITLLFSNLFAQQQLENPGFEEWENVGLSVEEPVNWSSIKTSDDLVINGFAPIVWGQSTDAHSGNYSLFLFNVYNALINSVASGTITNGQVHPDLETEYAYVFTNIDDDRWNSDFSGRPDSVVGWFKCNPTGDDFGTVKFSLHTGYAQIPGEDNNNIALAYYELPSEEITQWTRFSTPFIYSSTSNPEYYLSVITSGNGLDAVDGSTAIFDDLEFIYNESSINELSENLLEIYISNEILNFKIKENGHQLFELRLTDINGRIILKKEITAGKNMAININNLQSGIYIATAVNSKNSITKKVLIN